MKGQLCQITRQFAKKWLKIGWETSFLVMLLFAPGRAEAKWVWVQIQGLKSLEYDLFSSDLILFRLARVSRETLAKEPSVKSVLGSTFREFVFELSDENISEASVAPLLDRVFVSLDKSLSEVGRPPSVRGDWGGWLKSNFAVGFGDSPKGAFVNLKTSEFQMDYLEWKSTAMALRQKLRDLSRSQGIPWKDLLEASRLYGRNPVAMQAWLQKSSINPDYGPIVSKYGHLLTLADYLDPGVDRMSDSEVKRLESDREWSQLVVMDIKQLGATNRAAQDFWLQSGASLENIEDVSSVGTKMMNEVRFRVRQWVSEIPGRMIRGYYEVGDSIVIGLLNDQHDSIKKLLDSIRADGALHLTVEQRNGSSLQETLNRAASGLKDSRKVIPARYCHALLGAA